MTMDDRQKHQIDMAEKLQDMLLEAYARRLDAGTLSDTGLGQLQKLLMQNGWSLDRNLLPESLKSKLTSEVDPEELEDNDPDVIALRSRMGGT